VVKQCNIAKRYGSILFGVEFKDYCEILEQVRAVMILLVMCESFPVKNIRNDSGN
jgi:hypothetical protein